MDRTRTLTLAVGIGDARPLAPLPGAPNSARMFAQWAQASGHHVVVLTDDEGEPVTLDRFTSSLQDALLAEKAGTHRLILFFAGHGMVEDVEQGLWLLSDWRVTQSAVSLPILRWRLRHWNVDQVSFIADACRSLPATMEMRMLSRVGVLGAPPGDESPYVAFDEFFAAQDGRKAFMIPGPTEKDDRCLFSSVVLQALWGTREEAFSAVRRDVVTGGSLRSFLQTEVPAVADRYGLSITPNCRPSFPEGDDIYFRLAPGIDAPAVLDLPPPESAISMSDLPEVVAAGSVADPDRRDDMGPLLVLPAASATDARSLQLRFDALLASGPGRDVGNGIGFEAPVARLWVPGHVTGESDDGMRWTLSSVQDPRSRTLDLRVWFGLGRQATTLADLGDGTVASVPALPSQQTAVLVGNAAGGESRIDAVVHRSSSPAVDAVVLESLSLLFEGRDAAAALQFSPVLAETHVPSPQLGTMIAYLYDSVGDVDAVRRLAARFALAGEPIPFDIALLARVPFEDPRYPDEAAQQARVGGRFKRAALPPDRFGSQKGLPEPDDWLNLLDPPAPQAVSFERPRREPGSFYVTVPAANARQPRADPLPEASWATSATAEVVGEVAGRWPWLRQGWDLLGELSPSLRAPAFATLVDIARTRGAVRASPLTVLSLDAALLLAETFRLSPLTAASAS